MTFDLGFLFGAGVCYLLLLFVVAYAAEQRWIPEKITKHPATYALSLGVYATSWSYYGSVGFAQSHGYNFLTIYLGATLAFLLAPVLLMPILRLTREFQLSSLADLFAFRYRSQLAGILVTLFMLAGTLPYIALQIRAVTRSLQVLSQETARGELALMFCATITLFAILFGARHISLREKHEGLVVAIAFESLIKLVAILTVAFFTIIGVFDGFDGLNDWLIAHPEAVTALYEPVQEGPWTTFLFLSFAAVFLLPRQFHMCFTENNNVRALPVASWAFPLFLLLFNLAIPIILWGGTKLELTTGVDYYLLGLAQESGSRPMAVLAFLGGLSAASAMMIVTSLALSHMCLTHILLPASYPDPKMDVYRWLLWARWLLIGLILFIGYIFYLLLEHNEGLVQLGLISFVAVAQFLPGIGGVLYWRRATRHGLVAGLLAGAGVWFYTLLLPLFNPEGVPAYLVDPQILMETTGQDKWTFATFWSLTANATLFFVVSLLTRHSDEEREAAEACYRETSVLPGGLVDLDSPGQFTEQLSNLLGHNVAQREVEQAMHDIQMEPHDSHPTQLRQLRDRLERNLSGLMGPHMARVIVHKRIRLDSKARTAFADSLRFIEDRLEESRSQLRGLAAELDTMRRYHRQVLQDLPIGVCSLGPDKEIVIWNLAMEILSGIERNRVIGVRANDLPGQWAMILSRFIDNPDQHRHKQMIELDGQGRWFNLHKAAIEDSTFPEEALSQMSGVVILVEDLTEIQTLEAELAHSERLASIGRLAAGVAHEIGNPVTGIACLAQNLKHESEPEIIQESVSQILQQTDRISDIVQTLITFSHGGQSPERQQQDFCLREVAEEATRLVSLSHAGKQVACLNNIPPEFKLHGDRQRLNQVFVNLLTNACDASKPGDTVYINCKQVGGLVQIDVQDEGSGIPEQLINRVFDPFFTTKEPGKGTGLGLPLVYNIIQDHQGTIHIDSNTHGTCVKILLPQNPHETKEIDSKTS